MSASPIRPKVFNLSMQTSAATFRQTGEDSDGLQLLVDVAPGPLAQQAGKPVKDLALIAHVPTAQDTWQPLDLGSPNVFSGGDPADAPQIAEWGTREVSGFSAPSLLRKGLWYEVVDNTSADKPTLGWLQPYGTTFAVIDGGLGRPSSQVTFSNVNLITPDEVDAQLEKAGTKNEAFKADVKALIADLNALASNGKSVLLTASNNMTTGTLERFRLDEVSNDNNNPAFFPGGSTLSFNLWGPEQDIQQGMISVSQAGIGGGFPQKVDGALVLKGANVTIDGQPQDSIPISLNLGQVDLKVSLVD